MPANCYEILLEEGYNLKGYSPDTYINLLNSLGSSQECKALFDYLQALFG